MEIAPIPGIRALPAAKVPKADFRLQEVFDIEDSARPGDKLEQRQGRKGAGAEEEEDERDDLMTDVEADEGSGVDYFA